MSAEPRAAPRIDLKSALRKSALLHFMYSAERFASFNSQDPVVRSMVRREVLQGYINSCIVEASSSLRACELVRVTVPCDRARVSSQEPQADWPPLKPHLDDLLLSLQATGFLRRTSLRRVRVALFGVSQDVYEVDIHVDVDHEFWAVLNVEIALAVETQRANARQAWRALQA